MEDKPFFGPITEQAFGGKDAEGPSPIIQEWGELYNKQPGDRVILWAGLTRYAERHGLSWHALLVHTGEGDASLDVDPDTAAKVERLLSPLAHESRFMLLQALQRGPRTASELTAATGLKGGNLYHHLRDLLGAYVEESDKGYALTDLGRQLVVTLAQIAQMVVQDRNTEGLVVGKKWETE
ncbi:MAG: ArsR/SmtB family transcription factor [Armatimonadota bacterium]